MASNRVSLEKVSWETPVWWRTEDGGNYRVLLLGYLAIRELHQLPRKKERKTQEGEKDSSQLPRTSWAHGTVLETHYPLCDTIMCPSYFLCWSHWRVSCSRCLFQSAGSTYLSFPLWTGGDSIPFSWQLTKWRVKWWGGSKVNTLTDFSDEKETLKKLPLSSYALLKMSLLRNDAHLYQGAFIFKQIKPLVNTGMLFKVTVEFSSDLRQFWRNVWGVYISEALLQYNSYSFSRCKAFFLTNNISV